MAQTRTYGGKTSAERAEERRARLLASGLAAFGTQGYAATTIEALCKASGVTARHFYEHFASREALLLAVYDQVLEAHRGAILESLALPAEAGLEDRVVTAIRAAFVAWTANPGAARVAFIEVVGVSPAVEEQRLRAIADYAELVRAVADDLHARGLASRPGRPLAARALVGALVSLLELWLTADEPPALPEMIETGTEVALALVR